MSGPYNYQTNPLQGKSNPYFYSQPTDVNDPHQAGSSTTNPSTGNPQDFFQFSNVYDNVSPEMLNSGLAVGQSLFRREWEKRMPGVSSFWLTVKIYFAVSDHSRMVESNLA
jgi:hypothetical protein